MRKVIIVEDDAGIRDLVVYALNSSDFEAVGCGSGEEFFALLDGVPPDLVLLDIMLPGEDGISILKNLRRRPAKIPVIMLTAKGSEYDRVLGLDLGADDYIVKPFSVLELISRIRAVLRRGSSSETMSGRLTCGGLCLDAGAHTVTSGGSAVELTYKEFELLHYLLRNRDIVLSRDKIMDAVWDTDFEGGSRTVDMHIKTLRQKLGGCGELIKTIRGVGYKLGGNP